MKTCKHGHEMTPDNIAIRGGHERCRTCLRAYGATHRAKRRAADQAPPPGPEDEA